MTTPTSTDLGPSERRRHDGGISVEGPATAPRARAAIASTLHWYYNKGTITKPMLDAGLIFALHFHRAALHRGVRSCLSNPVKVDISKTSAGLDTEGSLQARRRIDAAYDILEPLEREVIRSVAGMDERAGGDKRVIALKTGLRALVTFYKLPVGRA